MYVFYVGYERMIGKVASPDCLSKFQIQRSSLTDRNRADDQNLFPQHESFFPPSKPILIIQAHGGSYWVKRKARGCFLLVNRATESLFVVTLNVLNYVFIKSGRQKQAISRWRRPRH